MSIEFRSFRAQILVMRGRVLLLVFGCIVVVCAAALLWPAEPEPQYQGKRLSSWLLDNGPFPSGHQEGAGEAIVQMGTNALPFLLKWLSYQPPAWRDKAANAYDKVPLPVRSQAIRDWVAAGRAQQLSESSLWAFQLLGAKAAPAVPELTRMLEDPKKSPLAGRVMYCLGGIGEPARSALPVIQSFVHSANPSLARDAVITIRRIIPDASQDRIMR